MDEKKVLKPSESVKRQYFAGIIDDSPLPTGKISMDEASWFASILPIGGLFGNILYGFIMNKFGRKWPIISLSVPLALAAVLLIYAQNVFYLYIARALQGLVDGGVLVLIPVYFVEIANDSVRGTLASCYAIGFSGGMLLAYILGNYGNYYTTPIYVIITTIIYLVTFPMFPETPLFLVRQNKLKEAEKSIRFYKGMPKTDEEPVQSEISRLKTIVGAMEAKKGADRRLKWSDFTTKPGSRSMIIAIVLAILSQMCGVTATMNYTAIIFGEDGSTFSPNTSAMIIGMVQLIGTCMATLLIDRFGRRFLYIASSIGTGFGLIALGLYMMLDSYGIPVQAVNWFPVVALSFTAFISLYDKHSIIDFMAFRAGQIQSRNFGSQTNISCFALLLA